MLRAKGRIIIATQSCPAIRGERKQRPYFPVHSPCSLKMIFLFLMIMYLKELPEIIHIFYYEILFFQVKTVFFSIFKIILILKISMFFVDIQS